MKKFCILSGAYVNAGDFLIVKRTKEILEYTYPGCTFLEIPRNKSLYPFLEEINQMDALIIAGGPAYLPNLYPDTIPLVNDLELIKVKIIPVGLGWYGEEINEPYVYSKYKFTEKTKQLLRRMEHDAKALSCRDYYSYRVLNANAFEKIVFTGCPAWYDVKHLSQIDVKDFKKESIKKICISDPANAQNMSQLKLLIEYLKQSFKKAKILVVFHRQETGVKQNEKIVQELKALYQNDISFHNISYSADGFSIYNDCDFHIGFRVHAHIYNLSQRNISLLIEEDGRGAGVNEALGLPRIMAYNLVEKRENMVRKYVNKVEYKVTKKKYYPRNRFLIHDINVWIHVLETDGQIIYQNVYLKMQQYFKSMQHFLLESIGE